MSGLLGRFGKSGSQVVAFISIAERLEADVNVCEAVTLSCSQCSWDNSLCVARKLSFYASLDIHSSQLERTRREVQRSNFLGGGHWSGLEFCFKWLLLTCS